MRMGMTTQLFDDKSIESLFTLIDELNFVKEALDALQDRLTDEEFLSSRNAKQLVKIVTGEVNSHSKAAPAVH